MTGKVRGGGTLGCYSTYRYRCIVPACGVTWVWKRVAFDESRPKREGRIRSAHDWGHDLSFFSIDCDN